MNRAVNSLFLPAPAKLNLFLHINGQRPDGYHELETVFVFLDYGDSLHFTINNSGECRLETDIEELSSPDNLILKAAQALKETTMNKDLGVVIKLIKRLPMGGGVGGGSSDAATTLLALNQLWQLNLSHDQLANIGVQLGADVPVFVRGFSAHAQGVGEQLVPVNVPKHWYLVVHPNVHVSTGKIFSHPDLPRSTPKIKGAWQDSDNLNNDCEALVKKLYPEVEKALGWLLEYAPSRMTGTGACCFATFTSENEAKQVLSNLPSKWTGFVARSIERSPLLSELNKASYANIT